MQKIVRRTSVDTRAIYETRTSTRPAILLQTEGPCSSCAAGAPYAVSASSADSQTDRESDKQQTTHPAQQPEALNSSSCMRRARTRISACQRRSTRKPACSCVGCIMVSTPAPCRCFSTAGAAMSSSRAHSATSVCVGSWSGHSVSAHLGERQGGGERGAMEGRPLQQSSPQLPNQGTR